MIPLCFPLDLCFYLGNGFKWITFFFLLQINRNSEALTSNRRLKVFLQFKLFEFAMILIFKSANETNFRVNNKEHNFLKRNAISSDRFYNEWFTKYNIAN